MNKEIYALPDLPYQYDSLEPVIDARTMEIHHTKHHAGYIRKLNDAAAQAGITDQPVEELLRNIKDVPSGIRLTVRNNGGGHANHSLFWTIMMPDGGGDPEEELREAIERKFGGIGHFKEEFSLTAKNHFGSGWAWLYTDDKGNMGIYSTPNQDSPLMEGRIPLLGLDVWEHAYYLKYQNNRADYVENFWKIINWREVLRRYSEAGR